ncbi:MAG: hypothetical protein V3R99_00955 [Thermoguttaceae bacterium]
MRCFSITLALIGTLMVASLAEATIIGVAGPASSAGAFASKIIPAPTDALDASVWNTGMQGFDEKQGVTTLAAYLTDSGSIALGTLVDSHMIFLNKQNGAPDLIHAAVTWTFDGTILGVMSDGPGALEAASTPELGYPTTNYPAAGFTARGLEGADTYSVSGATLTVSMFVSQPGDWIRVVTERGTSGPPDPIPEPTTLVIWSLLGTLGIIYGWRRRKA